MAITVDPNMDAPGEDEESIFPDRAPVKTPRTDSKFFTVDTEEELYEENKKLRSVLQKLDNFLKVQHPDLLRTLQKMSIFDGMASSPDMEPGSSHPTSTRSSNTTARTASGTPLYKVAYINLNDDLRAESERKPSGRREEQKEGETVRTGTSTVAGNTKERPATSDGEILKNEGDPAKFQKDATILKFPNGNQPGEDDADISKSDAEKQAILQLSEENSHKLLLLASALENVDTSKKMSECKLQKHLFDSAKQLKLKEFKYDSNPSMRRRLFQLFYNQQVSVLSSVESFEGILLDDYEVHPFTDPNGAPNKALFHLVLTYVNTHFKTILQRKETNGFGDKAVLALQAQCASLTSVEQTNTQREFTGLKIASWESLSSYLYRFLVARDNTETAGNEYTNDALVDLFLSSLGTDNTAYYSILRTTLENQRADGQKISFADMELKFIQPEECHTPNGSNRRERANLVALNLNPLAASNRRNGKSKTKGGRRFENWKKAPPANSSGNGRPIVCFGCNKPGHKKSECPVRKEGNTANTDAARG
jgi:hypothetical protein